MPFLPPLPELPAPLRAGGWRGLPRWLRDRLSVYSGQVQPPPPRDQPFERAAYGAAQPLLGLRVLLRDRELLVEALQPAGWLALACGAWAGLQGDHSMFSLGWFEQFYKAFAVLAPVPSVIFANHYSRFAALVRWRLGLGACGPRELPLVEILRRLVMQGVLVAVALAPAVAIARMLPGGAALENALLAVWGLHWVVVEAFDDASVLQPGQTLRDIELEAEHKRRPWFVRVFRWLEKKLPDRFAKIRKVVRLFADFIDGLSKPWREEIALLEASPRLGAGFALATAAVLATPVVNLVFRPIIIAGATHLLAHIEKAEHTEHADALGEHVPEAGEAPGGPGALLEANPDAPIGERLPGLGQRFRG